MKTFGVFCLSLFLLSTAGAQQRSRLVGRVIINQKPVATSIVLTKHGKVVQEAKSLPDGSFEIAGVLPGNYKISLVDQGLKAAFGEKDINISSGVTLAVDFIFSLQYYPDIVPIKESVTVAAAENQTIEQVSKTVDVIDASELRDRADFSLVESLRTVPGFRVAQSGGFGRVASIKTRGLRNQDTAVLIDGVRFRDPTAISGDATSFLSDFTLTSVSRIEVLRGPGSSLYGTNAVGGTVDFQTPSARPGTHGQVSGAFGGLGLNRYRGNISQGSDNGKFGITAAAARTRYTSGIDGDDDANNTNLQTRVDINPWQNMSVSGRIFFSNADVRLNTDPDTKGTLPAANAAIIDARQGVNFTFDADDPDRKQKSRFFSGQVSATQIIDSNFVIGGYYQGLTTRRTNVNGPLGAGFQSASTSVFDGRIDTANAHVIWLPIAANTLTAGYEFEAENFENDGFTPSGSGNFFTRAGQRSHTFYAQDLASFDDGRLQLSGSIRIQRFGLGRPAFSLTNAPYTNVVLNDPPTAYTFDGSASYFFRSTGTKIRSHTGNGYRVPSLYERFGTFFSTFPSNNFIAIGDPFLKPEKTIAFDAAIEQNLVGERVRLSATYFYTRLRDIIGYGNAAAGIGTTTRPFGGYENQKGGIARGVELSAKAKPAGSTDIFASYTFTNSDQRTPQVSGSRTIETLGVPDHQFTLVATQRFGRAWVNFDFLATSNYLAPIFSNSTFNTYVYRFGGNRRGDLTGGYTFGFKKEKLTLRLFGTVENVFNQEYYENGFRTPRANARAGLSLGF